jgi:uncharacterized protein (DUF2252 family)
MGAMTSDPMDRVRERSGTQRRTEIVGVLVDAFADLMRADPAAFRKKFRKMAVDPFRFYRGAACLFYRDMTQLSDPWADERTSRVWIQGDLHAENFGTYMDSDGVFVFDVNDFDEAYLGSFTWDLRRLVASVALIAWTKALSDADIERLIEAYARAYVRQVRHFAEHPGDEKFKLRLDTTDGVIHEVLQRARLSSRVALLDGLTSVEDFERRFRPGAGVRELRQDEYDAVLAAYDDYLTTIPQSKRLGNSISYGVKSIVGRTGFGIGSAGLPAYTILVEGRTEALENDVVLSMKQANVAAPSRVVHDERIDRHFRHHGHRTAVSQRALQAHADPWLGHTELDGTGFVVTELSPYVEDLDWSDLTEPADMAPVLEYLGRATAKMHCVADAESEQTLVEFESEEAIASAIGPDETDFVRSLVEFGLDYAVQTREDHRLFVNAFRNGEIPGVESSTPG